jgi:eukaryotic-like serine/threonine-protein kinase
MTEHLMLPSDVRLFPASDLTPELVHQISPGPGDYLIARPNSRNACRLIDAGCAQLLVAFRVPCTIVDAVMEYSQTRRLSPEQVLEGIFPVAKDLIRAGILVQADAPELSAIRPSLKEGDKIGGFEILRPVNVLNDTEVYLARSSGLETPAAVKIARQESVSPSIRREAEILSYLGGVVGPRLYETGEANGRMYVIQEWINGTSPSILADQLRRHRKAASRALLLRLCVNIVKLYARLHDELGVIHADVHPRNVLTLSARQSRIVDFAAARVLSESSLCHAPRTAVLLFYDPATAAAALEDRMPPQACELSEQYSLAVLVRRLISGRHYLEFSSRRDSILRQIVEVSPTSFLSQGIEPWPVVEQAIDRALEKEPARRYPRMADFAQALAACETVCGARGGLFHPRVRKPLPSRLDHLDFYNVCAPDKDREKHLCSLYLGTAGVAYALYRLARIRADGSLLSLADLWAYQSENWAKDPECLYEAELNATPDTVGRASLFYGLPGVLLIRALVASARADTVILREVVHRFIEASEPGDERVDVLTGAAGRLLGCASLLSVVDPSQNTLREGIITLGRSLAVHLWARLLSMPPPASGGEMNLGLAHGWAGAILSLLRFQCQSPDSLSCVFDEYLISLAALASVSGGEALWPWLTDSGRIGHMPGLCNGSAGFVHLWIAAHQLTAKEEYARLAVAAGNASYNDRNKFGDLCCGLAGRAYAMLALYRHMGEPIWLTRAKSLVDRITPLVGSTQYIRRHSLFKGEIGVALLNAELEFPDLSCTPMIEPETS